MGFFVWEENPLLLQEANAIKNIACILLRKTGRKIMHSMLGIAPARGRCYKKT